MSPAGRAPERRSGLLLHPTSLPGQFGVGDLGPGASAFVDFLAEAGQRVWQVLPLNATGYGNSPYGTLSAFAGNPLLISPERLSEDGFLPPGSFGHALVKGRRYAEASLLCLLRLRCKSRRAARG